MTQYPDFIRELVELVKEEQAAEDRKETPEAAWFYRVVPGTQYYLVTLLRVSAAGGVVQLPFDLKAVYAPDLPASVTLNQFGYAGPDDDRERIRFAIDKLKAEG